MNVSKDTSKNMTRNSVLLDNTDKRIAEKDEREENDDLLDLSN